MLGIKQKFGCVYHPQSQGAVERANGTLKAKLANIIADSQNKLNWVQTLPLALMFMRSQTVHKATDACAISQGPYEVPPLEQSESELGSYVQHLTAIHKVIFQRVRGATEDREAAIPDQLQRISPGDWVYVKVFKRKWNQPRHEGPFKVILATPTALKVEGKNVWFHLYHCCRAKDPERTLTAFRERRTSPELEGDSDTTLQGLNRPQQDASPQEARWPQGPRGTGQSQGTPVVAQLVVDHWQKDGT